jgi:hypothetical protein
VSKGVPHFVHLWALSASSEKISLTVPQEEHFISIVPKLLFNSLPGHLFASDMVAS